MEEAICSIIRDAVDELNEQLGENQKITYAEDLRLIGSKAALDSISFVTLIAIIEDLISERLEKDLIIVNDKAFSMERSPFHSIGSLASYIEDLLKEEN